MKRMINRDDAKAGFFAAGRCRPTGRAERRCGAFTLVELLVVIAIIGVLITLTVPLIGNAIERARQTQCSNNLRQFSVMLLSYRTDRYQDPLPVPNWLSNLYGSYNESRSLYVCPSDRSGGEDGSKPANAEASVVGEQYPETNDTGEGTAHGRNANITRCSYLYEFNRAPCSWNWEGFLLAPGHTWRDVAVLADNRSDVTWAEAKFYQMRRGDTDNGHQPYGENRIPIISCYHHYARNRIDDNQGRRVPLTLRVAYAGNVFAAPVQWEMAR